MSYIHTYLRVKFWCWNHGDFFTKQQGLGDSFWVRMLLEFCKMSAHHVPCYGYARISPWYKFPFICVNRSSPVPELCSWINSHTGMYTHTHTHTHTHRRNHTTRHCSGDCETAGLVGRGIKRRILWASVKYRIITKTRLADAPGKQEFSRQPRNR